MSIKLNQEIWLYVERLYIHCHGVDDFKVFLKKFGIDYDNPIYQDFSANGPTHQNPRYVFMSEQNYDFANFMQTVPSYKYLSILERVIFDEEILATRKDGWNYYGESIRGWHPKIVEALKIANIRIDTDHKKISVDDQEEYFEGPDFLPYDFNDLFLDYIRKEINESYINGQLLAVTILSRKLLEVLVIRIFEVVFSKMVNGTYSEGQHKLWYDKDRARHHGLDLLLQNLSSNSTGFHEDKELVEQVCKAIEKVRREANKCVHRDYQIPTEKYLKSLKIEYAVVSARKLFKKYCNP